MTELTIWEQSIGLSNSTLLLMAGALLFLLGLSAGLAVATFQSFSKTKSSSSCDAKHNSSHDLLELKDVDPGKLPKHIAVIMDGNRRYGREICGDALQGHWKGMQTFIDVIQWCQELGVKTLTAYAFSTENWNRDEKEIQVLMTLFTNYAESFQEEAKKRKIRINIVSTDFDRLPAKVQSAVLELQKATETHDAFVVNFCLSYGSKGEIVHAAKTLCQQVQAGALSVDDVSEASFSKALLSAGPDPDILIRTSGEFRLSNFLLWQLAYTELFFLRKYWPQVTKDDLTDIVRQFVSRHRRFGA